MKLYNDKRMSNVELCKNYINTSIDNKGTQYAQNTNSTMFQSGHKIYSYSYLAGYYKDRTVYINNMKSTMTTQKHKGLIKRAAELFGLDVRCFDYNKGILTDTETGEVLAEI